MAGIFASLLALFGLGGCKGEETGHLTDAPTSYNSNADMGPAGGSVCRTHRGD